MLVTDQEVCGEAAIFLDSIKAGNARIQHFLSIDLKTAHKYPKTAEGRYVSMSIASRVIRPIYRPNVKDEILKTRMHNWSQAASGVLFAHDRYLVNTPDLQRRVKTAHTEYNRKFVMAKLKLLAAKNEMAIATFDRAHILTVRFVLDNYDLSITEELAL